MGRRLRAVWTHINRVLKSLQTKDPKMNHGIEQLRGSLAFGLDPDLANRICDTLFKATGVQFVCVWDTYTDAGGLQMNPQLFGLDDDGRLYWLSEELLQWLHGEETMTDNVILATPEALHLMPSDGYTETFDYFDGHHNFAVYAPSMHDPDSLRLLPIVTLSDLA
ncbi:hypothetical protein [Kutzneria sp. 744]|uniref:hypothetical protein n=1 Tax=Kutzneria sp. (strain 744) TaxID=345341 RepID=UPI0003EEB31F|nr:hypothetical protein [Kutzneria sp. 744]EWM19720.1 hypothetical protein KUTG_10024 [Kutzneria sp. 744]